MRVVILKTGEEFLITEKEFNGIKGMLSNPGFLEISRLQKVVNIFEISKIDPIDGQLIFGKSYILKNGRGVVRYFKDNEGYFFVSPTTGKKNVPDLKDKDVISEDDFLDSMSKNLLESPKPIKPTSLPPGRTTKKK